MTTLASVPASAATLRPVPRRQLAWVAWRRNRATVYGLGALLAALATYLLVTGLQAHAAYDDRRLPSSVGRVHQRLRPAGVDRPAPGAAARHHRRRRRCTAGRT